MSKIFWTLLSGTLLVIKSVSASDVRLDRVAYKSDSTSLKESYKLETSLKHLNFFHNDLFSASYLTLAPSINLKNWKLEASTWFSEQTKGLQTFSIREAYYKTSLKGVKLFFGRRLHEWTKEELLKPTGLWSNSWDFNKSAPILEGSTGLFIEKSFNKKNKINFFVSALSIPKLVEHNEVLSDGSVVNSTPWATSPPQKVEYNGSSLPINYALDDINYIELVQAFQLGATYDYESDSSFFKVSYLFAPSKDLDLGLDFVLDSSTESTPVEITIDPVSYNIHRLALDFGFKWNKSSLTGFSFNHRQRADEIINDLRQSFIGLGSGSIFQVYHKESLFNNRLQLSAFFTENTQINNITNGELGELLQSFLSASFRYVRGGGLGLDYNLTTALKVFSSLYYDIKSEGLLGSLKFESSFNKSFKAHVGLDLVEALSAQSTGFYRDFRRNDFVYGGLSYAF